MTEASIRGQKGMASVKDMPVLQDGPPPGGFPAVRYARRIANSGPSGLTVLLVSSAVIGWGMYQVGQGNIHRRCDLVASFVHSTFYVFVVSHHQFSPKPIWSCAPHKFPSGRDYVLRLKFLRVDHTLEHIHLIQNMSYGPADRLQFF